ncbi:MAG: DUF6273 domain-containing protein [Oscillospiraceae bacterium]|jgi:Cdc6-like AAA superfamily ATPase|nr:DUF6273 domain-containing protein [Oscillospiraceae bacterium]
MNLGSIIEFAGKAWRVLDTAYDKTLIISERLIENRAYDSNMSENMTWEKCSIRKYLNEEYYNSFDEADRENIIERRVANDSNRWFDGVGGNDTYDNIFLLSTEEADLYFGNSGDYSNKRGFGPENTLDSFYRSERITLISNDDNSIRVAKDKHGWATWWWLRSPGDDNRSATLVDDEGRIDVEGQYTDYEGGIRPAMWVKPEGRIKLKMELIDERALGIIKRLSAMAGMVEFKAYMNELEAKRPYMKKWGGRADFPVQHFLFAVDPGNGCSTAAGLLHEYHKETGLYGKKPDIFRDYSIKEMKFHKYPEDSNFYLTTEYMKTLPDEITAVSPGVLVLNIEDWLNHLESDLFSDMMDVCWEMRNQITFIFKVPYLDEGVLARVYSRINDILNIRLIHFHPFTEEELTDAIRDHLNDFDISMDNSALPYMRHVLAEERSDRRFYGMQTINKLGTELVLIKARNASLELNSAPPDILTGEDFDIETELSDEKPAFEQLDELIGLSDLKRRIHELVVSFKADKQFSDGSSAPPCFHMLFTGSPGTGKTTVARIIGKIFREHGLLRVGDLIEVSRFDLVGEFIGQTGPKTVERCRAALGSVMFIDEAYLLSSDSPNSRNSDFGREAIGALVAEMENNRDKFAVIMAGYEKEMEKLFETNAGLRGRIPHRLHFPNYSREELFEIFKMKVEKKHECDEALLKNVQEFFNNLDDEFIKSDEFGNARFVRNLIERLRVKALLRLQGEFQPEPGQKLPLVATDLECALSDEDIKGINKKEKRRRIGFYAETAGLQV